MNDKLINSVFRTYIALARGEHFKGSDKLQIVVDFKTGVTASLQLANKSWIENESLKAEICADLNISDEQFFALGIIEKPSEISNIIYCGELQRIFGVKVLRSIDGFDLHGRLIIPKYGSALVPVRANDWITGFELWKPKQRLRAA